MGEQEQALADEILADAEKRAERARRRAEREAAKVRADAEKKAQADRDRILAEGRERAAHAEQVAQGRAEQELANLRLWSRERLIERVRAEAEERLARLADGPEGRHVLRRLALLAIAAMDGEEFRLILRPEDAHKWSGTLAEEIRVAAKDELGRDIVVTRADATLASRGGLAVRSADGRQFADQTFDERMTRLWHTIRQEVARMLPDMSGTDK